MSASAAPVRLMPGGHPEQAAGCPPAAGSAPERGGPGVAAVPGGPAAPPVCPAAAPGVPRPVAPQGPPAATLQLPANLQLPPGERALPGCPGRAGASRGRWAGRAAALPLCRGRAEPKGGRGGGAGGVMVGAVCASGWLSAPNFGEAACPPALQGTVSVTGFGRVALGMLTACLKDGSGSLWIKATSYFAG